MRKSLPFLILFFVIGMRLSAATITITNSGNTFNPATVTITTADDVLFSLASIHNAVEVDQATWNANGTTAMSGGFAMPLGGGTVSGLSVGTHYFVCQPHASMGMKGQIIVTGGASIENNTVTAGFTAFPNPVADLLNIELNSSVEKIKIIDLSGRTLAEYVKITKGTFRTSILADKPSGIYYVIVTDEKGSKTMPILKK